MPSLYLDCIQECNRQHSPTAGSSPRATARTAGARPGTAPAHARRRLAPAARHARVVEIRQQVSELAGALADTASGQQALFASPGTTRRTRPAEAARIPHRLITELTMLATATTVTKRRAPAGAPRTSPLFEEAGLSAANDG